MTTGVSEATYLQEALTFQAQIADTQGKITTASVCREAAAYIAMIEGEGSSALTADGILQSIEMAVDAETWALLKGEAANRIAANTLTLIGGRQG